MDEITATDVYRHLAAVMRHVSSEPEAKTHAEAVDAPGKGDECMVGEPIADW
jgi:hypothetical protein